MLETSPITGFDVSFPVKRDDEPDIHERMTSKWEFVNGFPMPRFKRLCGCGSTNRHLLSWSFISVSEKNSYRCCVNFICRECGEVSAHRMPIPQEIFEMRSPEIDPGVFQSSTVYTWREAWEFISTPHIVFPDGS